MDVFREGKFKLIFLMEKKLKGNEQVSWYELNDMFSGV